MLEVPATEPEPGDVEWEAREAEAKALIEQEAEAAVEAEARLEAEQRAREEAEQRARLEAEQRAREEAQQREREEAEQRARLEAEQRAREEAQQREQREREEAEQRARLEAQQRAREEAEQRARLEAQQRAREEAQRRAREEEEHARAAAEHQALIEAERARAKEAEAVPDMFKGEREALEAVEQEVLAEAQRIAEAQQRARPPSREVSSLKPAALAAEPVARPAPDGKTTTVLVVEDSVTMRRAFQMVFRSPGFAVETVESGGQALDAIRAAKPDIVVADLSLDDKDGYEICREIRNDPELSSLPVILLHSAAVELDPAKAREVAASGDIAKPFDTQQLIEKVCELTGATPF